MPPLAEYAHSPAEQRERFRETFGQFPIFGMIHLAGEKPIEQALEELRIYAEENGITVIDIPTLLFLCKEQRLITVADIARIIQELQARDYYAFAADVRAELLR